MHIIIDSNIIFSAIITGNRRYIELVKKIHFYMPDFALKELEKYEDIILKKRKLPISDFRLFIKNLFEEIIIIPKIAVRKFAYDKAIELCKGIDEKDTPFIALCVEFGYPLWTNDKALIENLPEKGFNNFINTQTVMKLLDE